jgi:hypothetical protein
VKRLWGQGSARRFEIRAHLSLRMGALAQLIKILAKRGALITEFAADESHYSLGLGESHVDLTLRIPDADRKRSLLAEIDSAGLIIWKNIADRPFLTSAQQSRKVCCTVSKHDCVNRRRKVDTMEPANSSPSVSRRRFLRQSFAFSALAALGSPPGIANSLPSDPAAASLLMIGDWGFDDEGHTGQSGVAAGMCQYVQQQALRPEALLMLGDNWYGELAGGVHSPRWQTQFEETYPADVFAGPAYAILGNHDLSAMAGE